MRNTVLEANIRKHVKKYVTVAISTFICIICMSEVSVRFKCASSQQIVKLAVYGMLPRNLARRTMMQRLHIFPDDVSPVLLLYVLFCSLDV